MHERGRLVSALSKLDLRNFSFVSIHAPSRFAPDLERWIVDRLDSLSQRGYPIVVHPDVLFTAKLWNRFGNRLLIENMDKRKPVGRNVREVARIFELFPAAGFCFDIGYSRQVDPSMTEASLLLNAFGDRLAAVHMIEVNTASRNDPISP